MPIYEYFCPENNRIYQFYAKTIAQAQSTPKCPDNPAFTMVKMMSGFAIGGALRKSARETPPDSSSGARPEAPPGVGGMDAPGAGDAPGGNLPDDPRMQAAFAELEREMGALDENDPRAMGRMMRRMSEVTGEPFEDEMEEMVRKLEEGQDPDKLEAELGDMMGEEEGGEGDEYGGYGGGYSQPPSRDPNLYDF